MTPPEARHDEAILPGTHYGTRGRARSFTWQHILFRATWNLSWLVLAAWTPPQLHAWRRWLLNRFGARIAKGARVYQSARIWYPPNLTMGTGAVLGWQTHCYCMAPIKIGDHAVVSQFAHLVSGTHRIDDPNFQLVTRPITIGAHVWIAAGAFVGPGVTVHEGAVLGARGVTFRDLKAWTVYAGNPAQELRARRDFVNEQPTEQIA